MRPLRALLWCAESSSLKEYARSANLHRERFYKLGRKFEGGGHGEIWRAFKVLKGWMERIEREGHGGLGFLTTCLRWEWVWWVGGWDGQVLEDGHTLSEERFVMKRMLVEGKMDIWRCGEWRLQAVRARLGLR